MTRSARVVPAVLRPPRRVLLWRAHVRLLLDGQARVGGRAQRADAALLRAQRARQRRVQRAVVAVKAQVAGAEGQRDVGEARPRVVDGGDGEAVPLGQRAPLPLLLLVHQACEDVDPPLLPPLGAEVGQHNPTEEDAVERHHNQDVQVRVAVTALRLGILGGNCGVVRVAHDASAD